MPDPLYPFRPSPARQPAYASGAAIEDARAAGIDLGYVDWFNVVLAITDALTPDRALARPGFQATYRGPLRDGERWAITRVRTTFDVSYSPERAMVMRVIPQRPAPAPKERPLVPLVGMT